MFCSTGCYVSIRDDSSYEGPESFTVSLTTIGDDISIVLPSNGSRATIIIDDEEDSKWENHHPGVITESVCQHFSV